MPERPHTIRPTPPNVSNDAAAPASRRSGTFYGWWIVAASSVTNGLGGSIHWQGFSVFFLPVAQSLGLSHAATALPFALSRAEGGIMGPITGWLIDRFGVRPLMFGGTLLVGIGYILLSRTSTYLSFVLVYLLVISIGASTSFMQATTASLNMWFVRKRGIVMGINSAAFRLGGAGMVPLLSFVILKFGWESAAFWVGLLMIIVITPLALVFRKSPEDHGLRPDGDPPKRAQARVGAAAGAQEEEEDDDWGVRDAVRTRAFWVLAAGTVLRMSVHGAIFVHLVAILVWKGEDQQTAANLIGLLALAAVPLILVAGWFSDKAPRNVILAMMYVSSSLSLFLLNYVHGTWPVFGVLLLFAGTEAGSALNWALVGDMFGRRRFASIRGMLAPLYNSALLVTPVLAGWIFDRTGSYEIVLIAGGVLLLGAAAVFLVLKKPVQSRG